MKRLLIAGVVGGVLAGGAIVPAFADETANVEANTVVVEATDPFSGLSTFEAAKLVDARGGMTRPKVKEIVVVGLGGGGPLESVVPELGGVVVLAATGVRTQIGRLILDSDAAGTAGGISEALVTTAAGIVAGFGDGIRGRVPSGASVLPSLGLQFGQGGGSTTQINPPSLQLDTGLLGARDGLGRIKVQF